ncbi:MAG TPA: ribonuclease G [Rhodanobacteraceae bacterium]|nr:ribonuclease G [Rhodanobacteraceae bacterium]
MADEILINMTPRETRVAVVENGVLQEVQIERALKRGSVGNIYKGRVTRVLPGMQAAFVEIGLERAAFLHVADMMPPATVGEETPPMPERSVSQLLHEGKDIIVQVAKDPIGSKGARLTAWLSIPSRYLVLLPHTRSIGVSARITDEDERKRLRELVAELDPELAHGYIVRTNAEGQSRDALAEDIAYLGKLWRELGANMPRARVGECVYEELSLPLRALRDLLRDGVEKVRVDSLECWRRCQAFAERFMPELVERIERYEGARPIFDLYGVEDELQRALDKEVPLKSGGRLAIDHTEAMTTIDVNTASFVGTRNLEETVYRTNLEAAQAAARQLRLRNVGGIVIIDFIDMFDAEHRRQVLRTLEKALQRDHVKTTVYEMSALGLVEMTRKRTTETLARQLCEPCPACNGRGSQKTVETVAYEIFREITRAVRQFDTGKLMVMANPRVVAWIVDEDSVALGELEEFIGKPILFQAEDHYAQEQFDVVLM